MYVRVREGGLGVSPLDRNRSTNLEPRARRPGHNLVSILNHVTRFVRLHLRHPQSLLFLLVLLHLGDLKPETGL